VNKEYRTPKLMHRESIFNQQTNNHLASSKAHQTTDSRQLRVRLLKSCILKSLHHSKIDRRSNISAALQGPGNLVTREYHAKKADAFSSRKTQEPNPAARKCSLEQAQTAQSFARLFGTTFARCIRALELRKSR